MSKTNGQQQLKFEARRKIRAIENDIKSEKMEMQSLIDQGRLITVPSPPSAPSQENQYQVFKQDPKILPAKPEKLYVIKVEPQRPSPKTLALEEKQAARKAKLEQKAAEKKIKHETTEFDVSNVPPPTPGRPVKVAKKSKEVKSAAEKKVLRRLPKCLEPPRRKTHWDYLLDEMKWLSVDFYQEKKWKSEAAKFFAEACVEEVKRRKNILTEEVNWRKRNAAAASEIIRCWWKSLSGLAKYQTILLNKKMEEKSLNLRPLTPDTTDDVFDFKTEIEQLEEDAKTPLHMLCDLDKLYPDSRVRRSVLPKISDQILKEAESLKQKILELNGVKKVDHSFNFDIELAHYQLQGIKWLIMSRNAGFPCHLADEKGLAKRTQVMVYLQNISGCSLLVVQKHDLYYWLVQLNKNCHDYSYCIHSGDPNVITDIDLVITTYETASKSEFLLLTRWNSLVFDNIPLAKDIDNKALATLKRIPATHRVAVTHTKPSTDIKNESVVSSLLFPDLQLSSRQLISFTLMRTHTSVPDKDRPRNTIYKTVKCVMNRRQKILYDDLLVKSKNDLDSQDIDRVMSAVKRLLRVCNHSDFRKLPKCHQATIKREINYKTPKCLHIKREIEIDWKTEVLEKLSLTSLVDKKKPKSSMEFETQKVMALANASQIGAAQPVKVLKIDSTSPSITQDISVKKQIYLLVVPNNSIYSDTISMLTIDYNETKAKRKGSMEFSNRLKNTKNSPWAMSETLEAFSNVISPPPFLEKLMMPLKVFVHKESDRAFLAPTWCPILKPNSTKLDYLGSELKEAIKEGYRPGRDPLRAMVCVRSDESASLVRSFFLAKFKVDSIYIPSSASESEKNLLIHEFNFSLSTTLLIFNTRAGYLPLPPVRVDKIIFYEDEILPVAKQIFDEDTVWRINPKKVIRLLTKNTIEERICTFSPKIYGQTVQGVHTLLTPTVPVEISSLKDRRRATAPPWQLKLCDEEELKIAERLMNYPKESESDLEDDSDDNMSESALSDSDDEILSQLTSIEKFALRLLNSDCPTATEEPDIVKNYFEPNQPVSHLEDDLFLSVTASNEKCVDQRGELLPIWTPPTPPRESGESHWRKELWEARYEAKAMTLITSKRIMSPSPKTDYELPISFFHRNSKAVLSQRRQRSDPMKPLVQTQFTHQPWLVDHEFSLLTAVDDFCCNSTVSVNWEEVSSVVNCFSSSYHSPHAARLHYENELLLREEGKPPLNTTQKTTKSSKKTQILGPDKKDRKKCGKTAQMYHQDNNSQASKRFKDIFGDILDVTLKRDDRNRDINQVILKPIPKLERQMADKDGNYPDKDGHKTVLLQHSIDVNSYIPPLDVVRKYKHRGLPPSEVLTRVGLQPTPRTPSSPSANRPIKNWNPSAPGQPPQMPSHIVRQKTTTRKRPADSAAGPGQKIFYQGAMPHVPRYSSPHEVHSRKSPAPNPQTRRPSSVSSPRTHQVGHRAPVPANQYSLIQKGQPIQIQNQSGIHIQSPATSTHIKTEYGIPQQVAISGPGGSGTNFQLVQTKLVTPKQEHVESDDKNGIILSSAHGATITTIAGDSMGTGETQMIQTSAGQQIVYVQGPDGQKLTLKPVSGPSGRQVIHLPPQQNTQYISVVNQHGKVIGSQQGTAKLFIKNAGSQNSQGGQVVIQPDGSQSLVIPSNMMPQQRLLVQNSSGNIIHPQGNKIFIQQNSQPIILGQGQQILTNTGQVLTIQPQQGKTGRMFVTNQPQQRVMVQQPGRTARSQSVMMNSKQNIVQVQQQPIQQLSQPLINPVGGSIQTTTIQPTQQTLPASETNITLQTTQFERSISLPANPTQIVSSPQISQPNWEQK